MTRTLLIIDDNAVDREAVRRHLEPDDVVFEATTARDGLTAASTTPTDCVLLDHRLPDGEGIDLLFDFAALGVPVVMLTGQGDQALAVEAMKRGAADYLVKGKLDRPSLTRALAGAIERDTLRREIQVRQRALALSEARKAAIMDAALDAIVVMDAAGDIVEVNAAAESLFGYARAEMIGHALAETLVPERLRDNHTSGLRRYLETGEERVLGRRLELPAVRKDGSEFAAEIAVVRIEGTGRPMFTGYIRDVTDRRRAAEADALQRTVCAVEEANAELEAFSYAVAHDLRAPLRALSGFGSALVEDQVLDEKGRRHVERIIAAAGQMNQLIEALLALSKTTRGEISLAEINVSTTCRAIMERLHLENPDRAIEVVIAEQLVVRGDARLVSSLLENLLANAWKFTTKVARPHIEVGADQHDGVPCIFVRDNGAGFDESAANRLFMPFQRLHSSSEFSGTGIGLATAARIVRRHGGWIRANSTVGGGATFYFHLPR